MLRWAKIIKNQHNFIIYHCWLLGHKECLGKFFRDIYIRRYAYRMPTRMSWCYFEAKKQMITKRKIRHCDSQIPRHSQITLAPCISTFNLPSLTVTATMYALPQISETTRAWDWGEGSVFRSTSKSSWGPRIYSQHLLGGKCSIIPVVGNQTLSSGLQGHSTHVIRHMHGGRKHSYINKYKCLMEGTKTWQRDFGDEAQRMRLCLDPSHWVKQTVVLRTSHGEQCLLPKFNSDLPGM